VVWVYIDGQGQGSELGRMAALRPHLTVHSGGGVHCHWRLAREQEPDEIESLNRRLCHLIGGDPTCTDRGRIMRLPGSFNAKRGRWCRVLRADRSRALVDPDQVRRKLSDPKPPRSPAPPSNGYWDADGLDLIDPPSYFGALAGVYVPGEGAMVKCPLPDHDDYSAPCQMFDEAERGWWCYGCSRGGRIYPASLLQAERGGGTSVDRRSGRCAGWSWRRCASTGERARADHVLLPIAQGSSQRSGQPVFVRSERHASAIAAARFSRKQA
jgi:hypothetical protein